MDGVINVLKPPGMTSHDVVAYLRKILKIKRIGHTGTLDPEAVGVLPICIGKGTRIAEYLTASEKTYIAEMVLGIRTNTQDIWGEILSKNSLESIPSREEIISALSSFVGEIEQIPPMFSAIKINGQNLYDLARKGQDIDRPPRRIIIKNINLLEYKESSFPTIKMEIICSKGTYIRTLCWDIGEKLGLGGTMTFLLRKKSGPFYINEAYTLEEIEQKGSECLISISQALQDWPCYKIPNPEELEDILNGKTIKISNSFTEGNNEITLIKVEDNFGKVIALGEVFSNNHGKIFKPKKVFKD